MQDTSITQELVQSIGWKMTPASFAFKMSRVRYDRIDQHWKPAKHLLYLSDMIYRAVTGNGPRFNIVSIAPRCGKSQLISRWLPTWFLELFPHKSIMNIGHGTGFASEWGGLVRNDVAALQDYLSFGLSEDSQARGRWKTTEGGGMTAVGIGADIMGRGADLMIIDDPVKNIEEASSLVERDKVWAAWTSTLASRLEPNAVVFVVAQRLHEDDLIGRMTSTEYGYAMADVPGFERWNVVNLPFLYDEKAEAAGPDPLGRSRGQWLWSQATDGDNWRFDQAELVRRMTTDAEDWEAMQQGRPARESSKGNVYPAYSATLNAGARLDRDTDLPLFWSLDFNVNPMCSVIGQYRETLTPRSHLTNEKLLTVEVLKEISLPNATTRDACNEFIERVKEYVNLARGRRVPLDIFGDASGNQRSTNGDETDWQIIKTFFRRYPEFVIRYYIDKSNPTVKSRVNSVNLALKDAAGFRRLFIDVGCVELKKDLATVKWKKDSGGNSTGLIEKSDPKRTHMSDALGYVIHQKFGIRPVAGEQGYSLHC